MVLKAEKDNVGIPTPTFLISIERWTRNPSLCKSRRTADQSESSGKRMSTSSLFGSQIVVVPNLSSKKLGVEGKCNVGLVIENSSRPKKKATAHHMKTRPRKRQPWDVNRKPTVYPPLPPLPPDWTLVSDSTDTDSAASSEADAAEPLEAPLASG